MTEYKVSDLENMNLRNGQEPTDQLYNPICQIWEKLLYSNTMLFSKIELSWWINQSNHFVVSYISGFCYRKNDQKKDHKSAISGWWEALSFSDGAIQTLSSKALLSMAVWSMVSMQSRGKSHMGLGSSKMCGSKCICDMPDYLLTNSVNNLLPPLLYKN